jgi:hypothetical protein
MDQARLAQTTAYQQGQLALDEKRLAQQANQARAPKLNTEDQLLFDQMFPQRTWGSLTTDELQQFESRRTARTDVGEAKKLAMREQVKIDAEKRKDAAIMGPALRVFAQLNSMVPHVFKLESLPAKAGWWEKAKWLPKAYL